MTGADKGPNFSSQKEKNSDSHPAASYIHIAVAKVGSGRWRGCIITSHIVLSHDCRDGVIGQGA